jgi:hypothetical protein
VGKKREWEVEVEERNNEGRRDDFMGRKREKVVCTYFFY